MTKMKNSELIEDSSLAGKEIKYDKNANKLSIITIINSKITTIQRAIINGECERFRGIAQIYILEELLYGVEEI